MVIRKRAWKTLSFTGKSWGTQLVLGQIIGEFANLSNGGIGQTGNKIINFPELSMHNSASSFAYSKGVDSSPPHKNFSAGDSCILSVCVQILRKLTIQLELPSGVKQTTSPVCGNVSIYISTYVCSPIVRVCPQSKFVSCQQIFIQCNRFVDFKLFNFPLAQLGE